MAHKARRSHFRNSLVENRQIVFLSFSASKCSGIKQVSELPPFGECLSKIRDSSQVILSYNPACPVFLRYLFATDVSKLQMLQKLGN